MSWSNDNKSCMSVDKRPCMSNTNTAYIKFHFIFSVEPKKTSKEITSKIPLSQRTTRRKQESVQQQNKENISENGIDENLPAHPESDLSTKPVSVRSVGKKAPISSKSELVLEFWDQLFKGWLA